MKATIEFNLDDPDDKQRFEDIQKITPLIVFPETIYDVVFRPVIKYGEDETQVKYYEEVWEKVVELMDQLEIL